MSELSPAALTVWSAFLDRYEWEVTTEELFAVAAVLRAAMTAVGSEEVFHPNSKRTEGVKWCVQRIYAIADELEAQ